MESLQNVVEKIKSVKVQGAREIAIYALKFLKKFCKKNGFGLKFEVACYILEEARPTAVVLHNCLEILKKRKSMKTFDYLLSRLENSTKKLAKIGSKIIRNNYKIMTHCHSGEALAVIKQAWKEGKKISVIATETDPLEQGVITAKELAKLKIPVTLIADNAAGFFVKEIDCVIVGADALRVFPPLGFINKIGTLHLALAAKEFKKPFYVVANTLKIDKRKKLFIEERPAKEVYQELLRKKEISKKIRIRNPAFDFIPYKFVTGIVTEKGIKSPKEILAMR
jgi:ribose 1,5-bisphosphate isomerase